MTKPVEGSPPPHATPQGSVDILSNGYEQFLYICFCVVVLAPLDCFLLIKPDLVNKKKDGEAKWKVTFHALRFAPPILELGNKLAERMRSKGPYLALHLRMEKDVWVRTDCLLGLSHEYDEIVNNETAK
nr:uncharacterized protein CFP56_72271 [Quercus suber]